MTDFEKHGYWWLPQAPEKRVAGTVVYGHTRRSELRLLGSFDDVGESLRRMATLGGSGSAGIILGATADGERLTLYDCMESGGQFVLGSFMTRVYLPTIVLEGRHFESADEIVFHHVTARVPHLDEWYGETGRTIQLEEKDSRIQRIAMTYQHRDATVVAYDGGHIRLSHDTSFRFARSSGDFTLSEKACVSVCPNSPAHMHQFLEEHLPPIADFIAMGIGRRLSLIELRGKAAADCPDGTEEQVKRAPSVQLYWAKEQRDGGDGELTPHDMVCTCSDLKGDLGRHVRQWVEAYRTIKPMMQLFFGRVLGADSFSSNSFLNSVQAAEAYHRYRRPGVELPEAEHRDRVSRILRESPDEHQDWLARQLEHSNEVGLRRRLKELLRERADLFGFTPSDVKRHADRIAQIRNYFTHYSGEENPDFATGHDFYTYHTLMMWTVLACLLEECGIQREQAHALIARNQAFLHFRIVYLQE